MLCVVRYVKRSFDLVQNKFVESYPVIHGVHPGSISNVQGKLFTICSVHSSTLFTICSAWCDGLSDDAGLALSTFSSKIIRP